MNESGDHTVSNAITYKSAAGRTVGGELRPEAIPRSTVQNANICDAVHQDGTGASVSCSDQSL
jgi:hypothetical protein